MQFPQTIYTVRRNISDEEREELIGFREQAYSSAMNGKVKSLLTFRNDAKTIKGEAYGVSTAVMYLAPADYSGHEVCPSRTKGCTSACLFTAGQGRFRNVKVGRLRRTYQWLYRREEFLDTLLHEIVKYHGIAERDGQEFACRLNGTSDIAWEDYPVKWDGKEHTHVFDAMPNIQFYDYTKRVERLEKIIKIPNYHITFSRAETAANHINVAKALDMGVNTTVVFRDELPPTWMDRMVLDADSHDIRFWDNVRTKGDRAVILGLIAKGPKGKNDRSGFVVDL